MHYNYQLIWIILQKNIPETLLQELILGIKNSTINYYQYGLDSLYSFFVEKNTNFSAYIRPFSTMLKNNAIKIFLIANKWIIQWDDLKTYNVHDWYNLYANQNTTGIDFSIQIITTGH
ncbi:hypothetical protein SATRI_v1c12650 [Spiroplasma atrichopogonis]|nr:hypothetical protein SATRI_v1c12650 [Spiroplasma atrichopogonis]